MHGNCVCVCVCVCDDHTVFLCVHVVLQDRVFKEAEARRMSTRNVQAAIEVYKRNNGTAFVSATRDIAEPYEYVRDPYEPRPRRG